jgi:hypothetical protein
MKSSKILSRLVHGALCITGGLFMAACKDHPQSKAAAAEITLPTTWSSQDSASLEAQLAAFTSGPWHDAPCDGCQAAGEVRIRSRGRTIDIKADSGPVLRAVAEIQNQSGENVQHGPSGYVFKAHHKYLMWVSRRTDHKATWGFFEYGPQLKSTADSVLKDCGDPPMSPKIDDANFYDCGDGHTSSYSLVKSAYAAPRRLLVASIPKTGWISCDPDCCTGTGKF